MREDSCVGTRLLEPRVVSVPARRRLPLFTLALVCVCLLLIAAPEAAARLRFERARLATEPWRFLLGHLVHERSIAIFDLMALAGLGAWWEQRSRAAWTWILLVSALLASLALLATPFTSYTGSSALGSGLFVAGALDLVLGERGGWRIAGTLALVLFAAKCAFETAGVEALFAELPPGTRVASAAHAAGGMGGALVVLARHFERMGRKNRSAGVFEERE